MIETPTTPTTPEQGSILVSPAAPSPPNEFRALIALTVFPFIAMMRNISTFAFGFLFPVVFISVFGLIGSGGSGPRLGIPSDVARGPAYDALENYPTITLIPGDRADLERQLRLGKLDGVVEISGLSAHADRDETLRWLGGFTRPPRHTYLVHGEPEGAEGLAAAIRTKLGWDVTVAADAATVPLGDSA